MQRKKQIKMEKETSIPRIEYLQQLRELRDKQVIKVITGIRRCGKSTLLKQFQEHLKAEGVKQEQIISLNLEDLDNESLCDYRKLHAHVTERLKEGEKTYVFLDEIQQVESFQKAIDSLYIKPNVDLYITGSNAYMLSQELATLLSGRYIEIKMMPLSFKEYVSGINNGETTAKMYVDYVKYGSFPYTIAFGNNQEMVSDYLQNIFSTVILKDIITRKNFKDTMMLESVTRFVFDNIGSQMSTKSIADAMTSNGRKIDSRTVERYLYALEESFVVYRAQRYDLKGKELLKTLGKYYIVDPGLRMMLLGNRKYDTGHILENVIYLELLRRYKKVYIGKLDCMEVDFVCESENGMVYYQVAATTREESTLERELKPLNKLRDHYPKYLLTLDDDPETDYNGILKINAIEWLLS